MRGNIPLAAGYLKLFAQSCLGTRHAIDIFPMALANQLPDQGLAEDIAGRQPDLVGFTCYLWNVERTLWVARRIKELSPTTRIVLGGPEITGDNQWVLGDPAIDFAAIGEGEQTFAALLAALEVDDLPRQAIPGLYVRGRTLGPVPFRSPLESLDPISSPYLAGILDAREEETLLLETVRGCVYKCKFCYYPKSYDSLHFLSEEKLVANLRHARERGAREVVLLDPTLNQRANFSEFLRLLIRENPRQEFTFFGELRAEGITPGIAALLRQANFTDVEVGLQSLDPAAQSLMDRRNHRASFERGVRALEAAGIRVKVDLIIGLPGDTPDSIRAGYGYLQDANVAGDIQIFQLSILPGTAFRQEAAALGLEFQSRPPYYVLKTPTLALEDMIGLLAEGQERFETEFDPWPAPRLVAPARGRVIEHITLDLDADVAPMLPPAADRAQAFTLRLRAGDWARHQDAVNELVQSILRDNPHSTLEIILECAGDPTTLSAELLERLLMSCHQSESYLDRFYSILPGDRPVGAKRLVVLLSDSAGSTVPAAWLAMAEQYAVVMDASVDCSADAYLAVARPSE